MGFNPDQPRDEMGRFAPGDAVTIGGKDPRYAGQKGRVANPAQSLFGPDHVDVITKKYGQITVHKKDLSHTPSTPAQAKAKIKALQAKIAKLNSETAAIDRQLGKSDRAADRGDQKGVAKAEGKARALAARAARRLAEDKQEADSYGITVEQYRSVRARNMRAANSSGDTIERADALRGKANREVFKRMVRRLNP